MNTCISDNDIPQANKTIVRVRSTSWNDSRGIHAKKSLIFLRKKCNGTNVLEEDYGMAGTDTTLSYISNLWSCGDGIFEVLPYSMHRDHETGLLDDWYYKLVPYNDQL